MRATTIFAPTLGSLPSMAQHYDNALASTVSAPSHDTSGNLRDGTVRLLIGVR